MGPCRWGGTFFHSAGGPALSVPIVLTTSCQVNSGWAARSLPEPHPNLGWPLRGQEGKHRPGAPHQQDVIETRGRRLGQMVVMKREVHWRQLEQQALLSVKDQGESRPIGWGRAVGLLSNCSHDLGGGCRWTQFQVGWLPLRKAAPEPRISWDSGNLKLEMSLRSESLDIHSALRPERYPRIIPVFAPFIQDEHEVTRHGQAIALAGGRRSEVADVDLAGGAALDDPGLVRGAGCKAGRFPQSVRMLCFSFVMRPSLSAPVNRLPLGPIVGALVRRLQ